jgi:hypothetical protein
LPAASTGYAVGDRKEVVMDRDATNTDRSDEARQGDTGMVGSEAEEPGPGRDTSLTDPDPVAASTDTRLGSHVEGAGAIGYDVAASEEDAAVQEAPAEDRPGYEPERSGSGSGSEGLAAEPVVDQGAYEAEESVYDQEADEARRQRPGDGR